MAGIGDIFRKRRAEPGLGVDVGAAPPPAADLDANDNVLRRQRIALASGGAVVLGLGAVALLAGAPAVGWSLVWLVIALAALNLFVGFCAGCAVYYWLARLRLPGFAKSPPQGTWPGMRPKSN